MNPSPLLIYHRSSIRRFDDSTIPPLPYGIRRFYDTTSRVLDDPTTRPYHHSTLRRYHYQSAWRYHHSTNRRFDASTIPAPDYWTIRRFTAIQLYSNIRTYHHFTILPSFYLIFWHHLSLNANRDNIFPGWDLVAFTARDDTLQCWYVPSYLPLIRALPESRMDWQLGCCSLVRHVQLLRQFSVIVITFWTI